MAGVVVIGGGIAGLAAAYDLVTADPTLDLTLLEASDRVGGKIHTTMFAGLPVDEGADAFLARVPWAHELCAELGLADDLTSPANGSAYIYSHGELRRVPPTNVLGVPLDFDELARSGIVSDAAVASARADSLRTVDPVTDALTSSDSDESIGALIRRRLGDEVNERLVDPLIGGIYASSTDELSLNTTAAQFADAARRHASLTRALADDRAKALAANPGRPVFYGHPQGTARLTEALHRRLGVRVRTGAPVQAVTANGRGYRVRAGGTTIDADAVIVAAPAWAAAPLLHDLAPAAAATCASVAYASVALVTLAVPASGIERPLDASGFLVPKCERRFITAASWASTKWAHLGGGHHAILRVSAGHSGDESPLALDDDELVRRVLADIRSIMGPVAEPSGVRISRWPRSFPQYRPGHRHTIARLVAELQDDAPRLFLTGAAYGGIGIPATIHHARTTAASVRAGLAS